MPCLAFGFIYAHDILVGNFRFFQGFDNHPVVVGTDERELFAERTGVLGRIECFDRTVQYFGFGCGCRFVERTGMTYDAVCECMVAEILMILIGVIAPVRFRCMQQGQTDGIVVRLVPTVFAVVQNRDSVAVVPVGQVSPLMCIYFVGGGCVVASFDATDTQIVRSVFVGDIQREFCFQQPVGRLPSDFVVEVDAVGEVAFIKPDVLSEKRFVVLFLNAERFPQCPVFRPCDFHVVRDRNGFPVDRLFQDFPSRPCVGFVFRKDRQTDGFPFFDEFFIVAFVDERNDVSVFV